MGRDGAGQIQCSVYAGLIFDREGNLYGTSNSYPPVGGSVFELKHSADGWRLEVLYDFKGGTDGVGPNFGSLVLDSAGNLYGTTFGGGTGRCKGAGGKVIGCGVVFKLRHAVTESV